MKSRLTNKATLVNQLDIHTALLNWYDGNARALSWRVAPIDSKMGVKPDPYRVWLSEIMLQQTGVKVVEPYFQKFVRKWPKIHDLHKATETAVLAAWSGLGYYRRARNLKACAEILCTKYQGNFPQEESLLLKLPGIGKYTSAAILTIAFGIPAIVVDGNIERIVARLFNLQDTLEKLKPQIYKNVSNFSPTIRPGDFAQAMMDLGATVCKPKNPLCKKCPIQNFCKAFYKGNSNIIPKKSKKKIRILKKGYVYIGITKTKKIAMVVRPNNGLLGGMTCPPSSDWKTNNFPTNIPPISGSWIMLDQTVKHTFTHFDLELKILFSHISDIPENYISKTLNQSLITSTPTVMRKAILAAVNFEKSNVVW